MSLHRPSSTLALYKNAFKAPAERNVLLLCLELMVAQLVVFKLIYPFPNFLPDSYSYIHAASNNDEISTWPIGYSKFLRLVSVFTSSHVALIGIQYLILALSLLNLVCLSCALFDLRGWILTGLLLINICNPLLLYISNFVSSDSLFASLSIVWFTQLIYIIFRPTSKLLVFHAFVLLAVFMVRYNAIFYPLVSVVIVMFQKLSKSVKIFFVIISVLFLGFFVSNTMEEYSNKIGTRQFSSFAGWQLASNALYGYSRVSATKRIKTPKQFESIQKIVDKQVDSFARLRDRPDADLGIYFLWNEKSPLNIYVHTKAIRDTGNVLGKGWGDLAPFYSNYGSYLISHYPRAYLTYYILPNLINYYVPDPEFLSIENMGKNTIDQNAVEWFKLKDNNVNPDLEDNDISVTRFFSYGFALVNVFYVLSLVGFACCSGLSKNSEPLLRRFVYLNLVVWTCNVIFSVIASPIVLRYQLFPLIISLISTTLQIRFLIQKSHKIVSPGLISLNSLK